jgi:uncharacterized membrane protein SpoIIM required for sporulation
VHREASGVQTREAFVQERSPHWRELSDLLALRTSLTALEPSKISRVAALYRAVCADLMRARRLGCGRDVIGYLDGLTAEAHNALYSSQSYAWRGALDVLWLGFPRAFRKHWRFMLASALLFIVPLAIGFVGSLGSNEFSHRVLPPQQLEALAEAYSHGFSGGRDEQTDAAMTGFYVNNNVGIAFRCFATGILFGLGSAFFLIFNGLSIGTVFGYVTRAGFGANISTFVMGHSPFELTAIVIAGGAGLRMGYALISTQGLTRLGSLRRHTQDLVALVVGAASMLIIAAFIEAFWSPSSFPRPIKIAFAISGSVGVALYLLLAGRERRRAEST